MSNIVERVKLAINDIVVDSIKSAIKKGEFADFELPEISLETPREKEHGDFSCNCSMQLARTLKKAPMQIANVIIANMKIDGTYVKKVECAGAGFINFYLNNLWLYDAIIAIQEEKSDYGKINIGKGKKVMVEFVSANPTGPLHMGNARGGALGDSIASLLECAGYDVKREFYLNDAGNQILKLGESLEARYVQLLKGEDAFEFPEDGYHGEDISEHMQEFINLYGDKYLNEESQARRKIFGEFALNRNVTNIKKTLSSYGVDYDLWFSESSLYENNEVSETLEILKEKGHTYELDGAIWLRCSKLGGEKDEVLVKSNGLPTYYAADIAYHRNKFEKRGFDWGIDLLGADHHGHVARMKYALKALDINPDKLDIVLFQLVRLLKSGEIVRMSKRTGKAIALEDLLEETGRDAARFFFNMKSSGVHLDFDLDLAVKQSNENPVFYVQYAHARICSILRVLEAEETSIAVVEVTAMDLEVLVKEEELELMKRLAELPEEIAGAANSLEPSRLTRYIIDVAGLFHSFYNVCRIKGEEPQLIKARLALANSTRTVIKNVLDLFKISSPEKM